MCHLIQQLRDNILLTFYKMEQWLTRRRKKIDEVSPLSPFGLPYRAMVKS